MAKKIQSYLPKVKPPQMHKDLCTVNNSFEQKANMGYCDGSFCVHISDICLSIFTKKLLCRLLYLLIGQMWFIFQKPLFLPTTRDFTDGEIASEAVIKEILRTLIVSLRTPKLLSCSWLQVPCPLRCSGTSSFLLELNNFSMINI